MAKETIEVLAKMPPPNGWQGWPTGIQAAVKCGISISRLRMLVQTGNITMWPCPDRTNRYDPHQLELLAKDLKVVTQNRGDDEDDGLEALEEAPSGKAAVNDAVNKTLVEALKNANSMVLEMHKLLSTGSKSQADTQDKVIGRLLQREEAREKTICDVYAAREAYFNEQTSRDLQMRSAANVETRRQEMWTITKSHLDKLVDVAFAKFGIPKAMLAKLEPAIELLQKLSPTQLQMLLGSGFLSKEQEELVKKIVTEIPDEDATVAGKVAAECEAILQQQEAEKRQAQAAQAAEAARIASSMPAPIIGTVSADSTPAPAPAPAPANENTKPADSASKAGDTPTKTIESEKSDA